MVDHGLVSLVGPAGAPSTRVAGYRASEIVVRIEELGGLGSALMARSGRTVSVDEADDQPLKPARSIRQS